RGARRTTGRSARLGLLSARFLGGGSSFFAGSLQGHVGAGCGALAGTFAAVAEAPGTGLAGTMVLVVVAALAAAACAGFGRLRSRSSSLRAVAVRSLSGYRTRNAWKPDAVLVMIALFQAAILRCRSSQSRACALNGACV